MTAQAPYEPLTSVALVDRLIDSVAEDAFAGRESYSDETKSARADLIAALPERAPVSAGGDAEPFYYVEKTGHGWVIFAMREGPRCWIYNFGHGESAEITANGVCAELLKERAERLATPAPPVGAWGDAGGWPDYLMLRDTKLRDDAGGLGQRIFTTAGAGYEKRKYVRADLAVGFADGVKACVAWVEKRRHDFEEEYGRIDPSTNAMEFGSIAREEYDAELCEIEEGLRALAANKPAGEVES